MEVKLSANLIPALDEMSDELHFPATLPLGKEPQVSIR